MGCYKWAFVEDMKSSQDTDMNIGYVDFCPDLITAFYNTARHYCQDPKQFQQSLV